MRAESNGVEIANNSARRILRLLSATLHDVTPRMEFTGTIESFGNPTRALDVATSALTALGFEITHRDASKLDARGPGLRSTKQNPLLGASRVVLTCAENELTLGAELGGAQRLERFVRLFPPLLCAGLLVVFYGVFSVVMPPGGSWKATVLAVTGGNLVLWLLLAPVMARSIRQRSVGALESLLRTLSRSSG